MRDFHLPGRSPVRAVQGLAATSMPAASLAAIDALRDGGNAVDGAIAAALALAVIEPAATGIGGDCFALVARPGLPVVALNASGRAPAAATRNAVAPPDAATLPPTSPHCVTVPGAVAGFDLLAHTHGRLGLERLVRPAVRLAEEGSPIPSRVAWDWAHYGERLRHDPDTAAVYLPGGRIPEEGDVLRFPALARTLRAIGKGGSKAFYEGEIGASMVRTLRAKGGLHTEADFAAQKAEFVTPLSLDWRGLTIWQCPPNGSGFVSLSILGQLESLGAPLAEGPHSAERLHRHIEAARLAYRDRDAFAADPSQVDVPVECLLDRSYLAALARGIDPARAARTLPAAGRVPGPVHADTVYIAVADRSGMLCSLIFSVFQEFGSGLSDPTTGVLFHNRGLAFRLDPAHPNCIAPGKRPMHTIIPGMATEGDKPLMAFGVMGGHFQPMGQTLFLTNWRDYGMDVQQALDFPRVFPWDGKVEVERGVPQGVLDRLARMGHVPRLVDKPHGGGQAVMVDHARGALVGGSDPRKDGCALGW